MGEVAAYGSTECSASEVIPREGCVIPKDQGSTFGLKRVTWVLVRRVEPR